MIARRQGRWIGCINSGRDHSRSIDYDLQAMHHSQHNSCRTRLAPSPTGAMHLGNIRTFLINWAMARQADWQIILRIEDIDTPRIKANATQQTIDLLQWIGIDWDQGPFYQSDRLPLYQRALDQLNQAGRIYPCHCTRMEIASAQSAPHPTEDPTVCYPNTCRPTSPTVYDQVDLTVSSPPAWRIVTTDQPQTFDDQCAGQHTYCLDQLTGDFVVATKQALPSYQLAVVVDDADQQITHIVRGDDLLDSTPRQLWLYDQLGYPAPTHYYHLPLVRGEDGRRLAKRHGDTRLATYQSQGISAERIIGLIASWCGFQDRLPMSAQQFAEQFDITRLPKKPITFTAEEAQWLSA